MGSDGLGVEHAKELSNITGQGEGELAGDIGTHVLQWGHVHGLGRYQGILQEGEQACEKIADGFNPA